MPICTSSRASIHGLPSKNPRVSRSAAKRRATLHVDIDVLGWDGSILRVVHEPEGVRVQWAALTRVWRRPDAGPIAFDERQVGSVDAFGLFGRRQPRPGAFAALFVEKTPGRVERRRGRGSDLDAVPRQRLR